MIKFSIHLGIRVHWRRKPKRQHQSDVRLLSDVFNERLRVLGSIRRKSTMDNYQTAVRSFLCYAGNGIPLDSFNQQLVEGYQQWLLNQGVTLNTSSCYMRSLRALLSSDDSEHDMHNHFKTVFMGKAKTDKRSIPIEDIRRLHDLSLPDGSELQFVRDMFLFSFYALGMPFIDLSFLHKSNVKDGYIVYRRHKTGQMVKVRIEPPMQRMIDRYCPEQGPYMFPILTAEDRQEAYLEYEKARTHYNYYLHRLSKKARLQCSLTSYVVRHSWASHAYRSNVELSVISKALGHGSPNSTLVYIREIDDCRIEKANHELIQQLEATEVCG